MNTKRIATGVGLMLLSVPLFLSADPPMDGFTLVGIALVLIGAKVIDGRKNRPLD